VGFALGRARGTGYLSFTRLESGRPRNILKNRCPMRALNGPFFASELESAVIMQMGDLLEML
jgi:hypothetical protein